MEARASQTPEASASAIPPAAGIRTLTSTEILQGEKKVLITHGDETYRLLVTRNDKLILQK